MKTYKLLILAVLLLAVTNALTFFITKGHFVKVGKENTPEPAAYSERLELIYQELEKETIEGLDEQASYEHVVQLADKSFVYHKNDTVYILNGGEVIKYRWEEPLDTNMYYQDLIAKFVKLFKMKEDSISKEDIVNAGFMPEAADYGFLAVYPGTYEDYKALIRYYILKRKELECEMLQYEAGKRTIEDVETCYNEYCTAKSKLTDYINSVTPGDI
ncbi:MAG TPA: hypothetical protein VIL89_07890 [Clostridia bacterium]